MLNPILDASNDPITVTNAAAAAKIAQTTWLPLGTVGDSTTGEIVVKTKNIGGTASAPSFGAAAGASIVSSVAYVASAVIKASAGTLISLVGYNSRSSAQWVQIFNSTTVPADTAVPIYTFTVAATSNFALDIPITGIPFTTGISVSNSSTGPTKTLGSADVWFTAVIV